MWHVKRERREKRERDLDTSGSSLFFADLVGQEACVCACECVCVCGCGCVGVGMCVNECECV